ncbi:MAG TPA: hypothetical protein DHW82_13475 [Spirochaetia bacterium]|nr:MAG: hypothetical protein A2Y41_00645 [Spirochaetes bacterium GWB1_36_13]HCL58000.1 hypothetical protein [Spirochaetia bacterium]
MKKTAFLILALFLFSFNTFGYKNQKEEKAEDIPENVMKVLNQYIEILSKSESLDECAQKFVKIAGGLLVNESGKKLREDVKPYSLKKDYSNIQFYKIPPEITRVLTYDSYDGYGESMIQGRIYKIWIDKKTEDSGMPAPISILVPKNHKFIKDPKVIGIGSL